MLLELYFEKWGGPVEEVTTIPAEQAAIITFEEEEGINTCSIAVNICCYSYGFGYIYLPHFDNISAFIHCTCNFHSLQQKREF